jgi:signal transduction histidine kinase
VLETALEIARPLIDARGHELTLSLPQESVPLQADPLRLAQVFANLLTNAAKYTDRGGHIEVSAQREGGTVEVRVRDDGVGLSAEELERVFQRFAQVSGSLSRSQGGLGIGLSLVRSLVQMHGGTVHAESAGPGQGSVFVVRLPLRQEG